MARLRNWFLTGIVVTAPIGIVFYLIYVLVDFVDGIFVALLPERYLPQTYLPYPVPGLGILFAILSLTAIGFLTANFLGRRLLHWGELLIARAPIVGSLYNALKQVFASVLAPSAAPFRKVALIEFPRTGLWTLAFVTSEQAGEVGRLLEDDVIGLFVPTAPNPTSGYFVYVPRGRVKILSMGADEAMRIVLSSGVASATDRALRTQPASAAKTDDETL
jgi:uncharacterized membrane protein